MTPTLTKWIAAGWGIGVVLAAPAVSPAGPDAAKSAGDGAAAFAAAVRAHRNDPVNAEMVAAERQLDREIRRTVEAAKPILRKHGRDAAASLGHNAAAPPPLETVRKKANRVRLSGDAKALEDLADTTRDAVRKADAEGDVQAIQTDAANLAVEIENAVNRTLRQTLRAIEAHPERYAPPKLQKAARSTRP